MSKELKTLEKLELMIPGFKGYKQKELIREDDKLIRNYLFNKIKEAEETIRSYLSDSLDGKIPVNVSELNNTAKDLSSLGTKIRVSSAGYSGYFDRVKVTEKELEQLKKLDAELVSSCEELASLAKKIKENVSLLTELKERIKAINSGIDARNHMFDVSKGE
jgi:DNA repair ATPase RecN